MLPTMCYTAHHSPERYMGVDGSSPDCLPEDALQHWVTCLKHLYNVETPFYCPQTFLSLDFQCRDGIF